MAKKKKTRKKKKSGINKSKAIREYKAANPTAGPTEIADVLSKQHNTTISPSMVSNALSLSKKKKKKKSKVGRKKRAMASAGVNSLVEAADFAKRSGGIQEAKAALDQLEKIKDKLGY